jgi:hypothetical protein
MNKTAIVLVEMPADASIPSILSIRQKNKRSPAVG